MVQDDADALKNVDCVEKAVILRCQRYTVWVLAVVLCLPVPALHSFSERADCIRRYQREETERFKALLD